MTPGSCSTGIHILLEECDLVFEIWIINLLAGDQYSKDYQAINPRGTITANADAAGVAGEGYASALR